MRIFLLTFLTLALGIIRPASADIVYSVNIDTSSIINQSGYLDFQFNGGDPVPPLGTVTISGFSGGTIGIGEQRTGDVSGGTLPSPISINNTPNPSDPFINDYLTPFTYGNSLAFKLSFSGLAVTNPDLSSGGSMFAFSLLDNAQGAVLVKPPQDNPVRLAFTVELGPDGNGTVNNFMTSGTVVMAAVPEPEEYAMMLVGAGMVAFQVKRKQKRSANS